MIPEYFIQEWHDKAPWQESFMVEQDLIICKALVCIFSDEFLSDTDILLREEATHFDPFPAWELVKQTFVDRMPGKREER